MGEAPDEFETISALFRPLTTGAPAALGLQDDAAVLAPRPGEDLVVTADALVEGVHFLPDDPLDLVARKLLRVNLSDLAAKGAEPVAYLLTLAWSPRCGWAEREAFAAGLAHDQAEFGVRLIGGDTVSTPGPLTAGVTAFGRVAMGRAVLRTGARPGDRLFVSGTVGDGWLGLMAARGKLAGIDAAHVATLAARYRLPEPRLALTPALLAHARAAADVSDGLIADVANIAQASGVAATVVLDRLPLSDGARAWLDRHDGEAARVALATGGDDYEIVCAVRPDRADAFVAAAAQADVPMTEIGGFSAGEGVSATLSGAPVALGRTGWRHGGASLPQP